MDRLNDVERRFLRLLAQGHTAKSMAGLEGCSFNAVNERLREARRKTGVGSSRELARMVAAQEIGDEQIGVADASAVAAAIDGQASPPARSKGYLPMLTALSAAAILLAMPAIDVSPPAENQPAHPLGDGFVSPRDQLAAKLAGETRDPIWADAIEDRLGRRIAVIEQVEDRRIRCGASLCEVSGRLAAMPAGSVDAAMQALQSPALEAEARAMGLTHVVSTFGADKAMRNRATYSSYWQRMPGR